MHSSRTPVIAVLIGIAALIGIDIAWNGFRTLSWAEQLFRGGLWFWAVVLAVLVIGALIGYAVNRDGYDFWDRIGYGLLAGGIVGVLAAGAYSVVLHPHLIGERYMEQVAVVDTATDFEGRSPWVVAERLSSRDQGDEVGDRGPVKAVLQPGSEVSRYTTIVAGRDALGTAGYTSVREFSMPIVGKLDDAVSDSCTFEGMDEYRWGASWPAQSLNRQLRFASPLTHFDNGDRYGYCDEDGEAVVVQPLWRYEGAFLATKTHAGAAVYDSSGFRVLDVDELDDVEGPVFPSSLAGVIRAQTPSMGTWWDRMSKRSGYDLTTKDEEDANVGNATELQLANDDGDLEYVTPLTPRGTSQSIVALFVTDARTGEPRIETAVDLPSTSTLEDRIRNASVAGDSEWATRWAAGMQVYEMVPAADGEWVASIGRNQEVEYRATIRPNGTVFVEIAEGTDGLPDEADSPGPVVVDGGKPVAEMSDAELVQLIREALDELESR